MNAFPETKNKTEHGYVDNKEISIESIIGIEIKKFRSLENQCIHLGKNVTVLSGRNGTMKTSMMGLIAHPFSSESTDAFGNTLKTALKDVFKLSPKFDNARYEYDLVIKTDKPEALREQVSLYWVAEKTNRHRVVVSGAEKGDGNFIYNTSFLNLKRLFPLVHTNAAPDEQALTLTNQETTDLKNFYETVFPSSEYYEFTPVHQKQVKTTFAPKGVKACYDYESISSGEDNLGAIFNRLIGFQRSLKADKKYGNGIFCIDEFESSLHPVAQLRLFDYLYRWSERYRVQVVISTHSLYLINHIYVKHQSNLADYRIVINFLSKSHSKGNNTPIIQNPTYALAYKELTFEDPVMAAKARKIKVFCEDEYAVFFTKKLIKSREVLSIVEFHSSLDPSGEKNGTAYSALTSLCTQFPLLLNGAIVVFDADVPDAQIKKIKDKNLFIRLPDESNLAIERRIIIYIINMSNGDEFFAKFNKERDIFLDEFKQAGIKSLSCEDIEDETKVPIKFCKYWADKNKPDFKKYITYYCQHLESREEFVQLFLQKINAVNLQQGLPLIALGGH